MESNMSEDISIRKKERFGGAIMMLGMHYTLKENIPPNEVITKINAQTDRETALELKRLGLLQNVAERLEKMDMECYIETYEGTVYHKIRSHEQLLAAEEGTLVRILVGIAKTQSTDDELFKMLVFVTNDTDYPIFVYCNKGTEINNISSSETIETGIVTNTSAIIYGAKIINDVVKKKNGEELDTPVVLAHCINYNNDFS